MRDWTGAPEIQSVDDIQSRKTFTRIDYFLRDLSAGVHRIQGGQVPDGSGTLITDVKLSDIYLVLLGRSGGQVAHGGTGPSQNLRLASTTDPLKGLIYLGLADLAAFDETNTRLGMGTTAATAKVHIAVGAPSFVTTVRPQGDVAAAGWVNTTGGTPVATHVGGTTTATMGRGIEGGAFGSYICSATGVAPSTFAGWNVGFSARVLTGPPGFCALSVNMDSGGGSWFGIVNQPITTGGFQDFLFPVGTASATAAVFSNLRWALSFGASPGFGEIQVANLRLELPVAGGIAADTLQKWVAGSASGKLDFGDSGASTVDFQLSGNTPWFTSLGDGSSGLRTYTSASAMWVEAGTIGQSAMNLIFAGNRQATGVSARFNFASATFVSAVQVAQLGIGGPPRTSPSMALDVTGRSGFTPVVKNVAATVHNFDIGNATIVYLSATSVWTVGGFTNGTDGRVLRVVNTASASVIIPNEDTGSTAANRILTTNAVDTTFAPRDTLDFVYDGTASRWRMVRWASVQSDETINGRWTFNRPVMFDQASANDGQLTIQGDVATGPMMIFQDDAGNSLTIQAATVAGTTVLALPIMTANDTIVIRKASETLENKIMAKTTRLIANGQTDGVFFSDETASAKKFRMILANTTASAQCAFDLYTSASRVWRVSGDYDAKFTFAGVSAVASASGTTQGTLGFTSLTGLSASLGATTLASAVGGGLYRVPWYIKITTAGDAEPTDSLAPAVAWNDGTAQSRTLIPHNETQAVVLDGTLSLGTLNRAFSGSIIVSAAASSNISISTTLVNAGATNPVYTLAATVESI